MIYQYSSSWYVGFVDFMYSWNDNLLPRVSPRCFWFELSLILELLKMIGKYLPVFIFLEKIIWCACLVRFGLSDIFLWYAQTWIFNRPLLIVKTEATMQLAILNKKPSSSAMPFLYWKQENSWEWPGKSWQFFF